MTITFTPTGAAECLYGEDIDLREIGVLSMARASVIEWNESSQQWEVSISGVTVYSNASRAACLNWEREWLGR